MFAYIQNLSYLISLKLFCEKFHLFRDVLLSELGRKCFTFQTVFLGVTVKTGRVVLQLRSQSFIIQSDAVSVEEDPPLCLHTTWKVVGGCVTYVRASMKAKIHVKRNGVCPLLSNCDLHQRKLSFHQVLLLLNTSLFLFHFNVPLHQEALSPSLTNTYSHLPTLRVFPGFLLFSPLLCDKTTLFFLNGIQ